MWTLVVTGLIAGTIPAAQGPAKHKACAKMMKEAEAKAVAAKAAAKLELLRPKRPTAAQRVMPGSF